MRAFLVAALAAVPAVATAHIAMDYPPPRTTELKSAPCGATGSTRGTNVTTLAPGSTITVKWRETIDHPGHFRISFDLDGQDFVVPPDATSNTEGMPNVIDDLIADVAGTVPAGGRPYTATITLPDVECTSCTLQVLQLMTDKPPYTTDALSDDIYYQCADITLSHAAPDGATGGDAGTNNNSVNGGCSAAGGGAGLPVALLGLALLGLVRTASRSRAPSARARTASRR